MKKYLNRKYKFQGEHAERLESAVEVEEPENMETEVRIKGSGREIVGFNTCLK